MTNKSAAAGPAETGAQRQARHWPWLNGHGAAIAGHAREYYEQHGRG